MEGIGLSSLSLAVAMSAALLTAQKPAGAPRNAEAYRPEAAGGAFRVDIALAKKTGLLDEVEHSVLGPMLQAAAPSIGAKVEDLDTFWMWVTASGEPERAQRILALVAAPDAKLEWPTLWENAEPGKVGDQEVRSLRNNLCTMVGDRLLVWGKRESIEPILAGEKVGGVPSADQLSLEGGRAPAVASMYADLAMARTTNGGFGFLVDGEYPADDMPTHLLWRIVMVGDEDDPHVLLEAVVRHAKGEGGLDATEKQVRDSLEQLAAMPEWKPIAELLGKATFTRSGRDLEGRVDLGRARTAVGLAVQRIAPLLVRAERDAVRAAPAAAPAPPPAPKEPGK